MLCELGGTTDMNARMAVSAPTAGIPGDQGNEPGRARKPNQCVTPSQPSIVSIIPVQGMPPDALHGRCLCLCLCTAYA